MEEPENHTIKDMLKEYPNLFLLKAFTKRYAMAGVRLGYGLSVIKGCWKKYSIVGSRGQFLPWHKSRDCSIKRRRVCKEKYGLCACTEKETDKKFNASWL